MAEFLNLTPELIIKDAQSMKNINWEDCNLLLKIGTDQVQWGVYKRETSYFIRLCSYILDENEGRKGLVSVMENILENGEIQAERCHEIKIILDTPLYTVVPDALYEENVRDAYFESLFGENNQVHLQNDFISNKKMHLIYGLDQAFYEYLEKNFKPQLSICHNQTLLLDGIKWNEDSAPAIYLTLCSDFVSVVAYGEAKPLLIQAYPTKAPLDIVYHILNVLENLTLKGNPILFLAGYDKDTDFVVEKLKGEFENVNWLDRPIGGLYPREIYQYPSHYFFHLVSLALCESLAENSVEDE